MPVFRCHRLLVNAVLIGFAAGCDHAATATAQSPASRSAQQTQPTKHVYDDSADAHADIDKSLAAARNDGKRILLIFGANWCPECLILDARLHEPLSKAIVDAHFHVVHVDIGRGDDFLDGSPGKNEDLAKKYEISLSVGVPAVAVLDPNGKLLYSQKSGEWTPIGSPSADAVVAFLNRWKPADR